MKNFNRISAKVERVINSCETIEQLNVVIKYTYIFFEQFDIRRNSSKNKRTYNYFLDIIERKRSEINDLL